MGGGQGGGVLGAAVGGGEVGGVVVAVDIVAGLILLALAKVWSADGVTYPAPSLWKMVHDIVGMSWANG